MRRRAPRPISLALRAFGDRAAPQSALARVQAVWGEVVGAQIAAHASPESERGGVISVRCSESVWAAELQMQSQELTERLNAALGEASAVSSLRFRVGP
jgi:predicted nucleic acid-binding Zn ribbon protein